MSIINIVKIDLCVCYYLDLRCQNYIVIKNVSMKTCKDIYS